MAFPEQAREWALCVMDLSVLLSIGFKDKRDTDLQREGVCIPIIHGKEGGEIMFVVPTNVVRELTHGGVQRLLWNREANLASETSQASLVKRIKSVFPFLDPASGMPFLRLIIY